MAGHYNECLQDRSFKVGLALEFDTHVLAFLTKDLLFQPYWKSSVDEVEWLPNVVRDYSLFLKAMVNWIVLEGFLNKSWHSNRTQLAISAFHDCKVAHGAGVYTSSEVFKSAGISPLLTDVEVFANPSHVARIICAFYTLVYQAYHESGIKSLVLSAMHGTVFASTQLQQQNYYHYLNIYGKERVTCTMCEAALVDYFVDTINKLAVQPYKWSRDATNVPLFDFFEPENVRPALLLKEGNLGHLVFGDMLWSSFGKVIPVKLDPITQLFIEHGIICDPTRALLPTYLCDAEYSALFIDSPE
ncbi:hypothetical protein Moror_6046 [Moniliophthora roreri MCA 2997]|uniref:Uncharacterized protein n=1 Tax=Moniliophthora roreri (strain MCA 2997) TaxID=1381753 RepID=V2XUQ9_MONRO|nr:hypothetical protein Moror_6046 [Moniliophthora roreri MCA 2997]